VSRDLALVLAPGAVPDPSTAAINALRTDITALAATREANETARRDADRARKERPVSFTERNGEEPAAMLHRFCGVPGDDELPDVHKTMASYKDKSRDLVTINLGLLNRGNDLAEINEINMPRASSHTLALFRNHDIIATGLEFGEGMNPFSICCQGHVQSKEPLAFAEKQRLLESGTASVSLSDAVTFQSKDARFPRDVNQATDKLWGFSVMTDVYLGHAHVYCANQRAGLRELCPQIQNLNSLHSGEDAFIMSLVIRIMIWIQQSFFVYMRKVRLNPGVAPPLPDFDALIDDLRMQMYDSKLPHIPRSWASVMTAQEPSLFPAIDVRTPSEPGVPRIRGGGPPADPGARRSTVDNPRRSAKLIERWANSGMTRIGELIADVPPESIPVYAAGNPICLTWCLKGKCNSECARKAAHKSYGPELIKKIHVFLDDRGVPKSE